MRATVMYRAGDVRIENIPDATIVHPSDAVLRITRACICGSDLWPYNELEPVETGRRMPPYIRNNPVQNDFERSIGAR